MSDTSSRIARTLIQFIVGGGLFELVQLVNDDLGSPYLLPLYVMLVALLQNLGEEFGLLKPLLRSNPSATEPQN